MPAITVFSPKVSDEISAIARAERLGQLKGMRIGFVDNSKINADIFIERLGARLSDEFGVELGETVRKLAPKDPLGGDELKRLSKCDAVIQCFGDCGTSTSISVADAVTLEETGVPTATVFSAAFSQAARHQAIGRSMPALPMVEIPHPMHTAPKDVVIERADAALGDIVRTLTHGSPVAPDAAPVAAHEEITLDESEIDGQELFFDKGWTDGLPITPPLIGKVEAFLATVPGDADDIVGIIPPRMRPGTVEKIAVNAVMAGCRASYFPVVLAAVEAMIEEDCKLYGAQTATNMSTPLLILNGPIVERIGANARRNVLGPGNRANATIGRAVRLVCQNIGGEAPNETDMATHGQPGKLSFCFAEAEADSPWTPFHVDQGFAPSDSTVSVIGGASSPHNVFTYGCENGEEILEHLVGAVTALGNNNIIFPSGPLLVFGPEHAGVLDRDGFSKQAIRDYIFEKARIPLSRFAARTVKGFHHRRANWFETVGDAENIGVADRAEDVHIVVAGGPGIHSLFIPTSFSLRPVTKLIAAG